MKMKIKILPLMAFVASCLLVQAAFGVDRSNLDKLKIMLDKSRVDVAGKEAKHGYLLEPLLPFSEAVDKAKHGYPQGYYALALHYAKGD
jgi:hypothetical protein